MPTLQISETTFARLQAHATPLVDSAETALIKVLDLAEASVGAGGAPPPRPGHSFASSDAPDLTHTTMTAASLNGKVLPPSLRNWNALMLEVIEYAATEIADPAKVADQIVVNHVRSEKQDNGYKYIPSAQVSVQGQNSNNAWKAIAHLAKTFGIKVEVSFYWANQPKAARPGETGRLVA